MIVVGLGAECNKSVIILNYQLSFINYQYIMKKILPDLIAILAFIILSFAYFFPADIEGRILFQHDTAAGVGAGQESKVVFCFSTIRWPELVQGKNPRNISNVPENVHAGQTLFLAVCLPIRCLRATIQQRL